MVTKKNLLIISPTLPDPTMSAGDYRAYSLTKELKKYFNIFFIPLNYKNLTPDNLKNFIKVTDKIFKPINSKIKFKNFLLKNKISICIIEKYFSMPFDVCKLLPLVSIPIIDVHEIGFIKSLALSKLKKTNYLKLFKAKELIFYKNAKILIAITDKEKILLQKYFPEKIIIVVPTCTAVLKSINKNFNERKDLCYFGYFGHTPNVDAANYFIKNVFNKIKNKLPELKFYVLGYGSKNIKNTNDVISVDNIKNILKELSKYKVFVCPLRYGAGLKKKILDAMAAKTPIVSTSFGMEGIKNIEKNFFSIHNENFVTETVKLYTDKRYWKKESVKNFNIVQKYYSISAFKKYVKTLAMQINLLYKKIN